MNLFRSATLIALSALTMVAATTASAADQAMRDSLNHFFAAGLSYQGAKAELSEVIRWPAAKGPLVWRMPHVVHHPARLSLIAEQRRGSKLKRWYVPVRLHWWAMAVVAAQDIPARTHLNPGMLEVRHIDLAGLNGNWWKKTAALNGSRTTRPLHAGQTIFSSYISRPSLLRAGDRVTLISHIGGVQVKATAKALRNAGIGDRIRVQNLRSKEVMQATIINAHTARIDTGGAS
ncbi:MAG: flagellar basal body P-ring formation chaperone FlgA [Mariprofundaceae bacterium]|nr:flagellar basal body P-ring formation chaperone FlgA [Mariprofundaceae bacterium]